MIIGITGKLGSGKTTLSNIFQNYGFEEYAFAQPLKDIARIFGFDETSLYGSQEDKEKIHPYWGISSRRFLEKLGTDLFREKLKEVLPEMKGSSSIWVELFKKNMNNDKHIVLSDVRYKDEEKAIKSMGGIIIKTIRDCKYTSNHISNNVDINFDYVIDNNVMTIKEVEKFVEELLRPRLT